jgi:hypothetical protein
MLHFVCHIGGSPFSLLISLLTKRAKYAMETSGMQWSSDDLRMTHG